MAPPTAPILTERTPSAPLSPSPGRRNGWIVLDRSWAHRLGIAREAGVYRIRRRELVEHLGGLRRECPVVTPARWACEPSGALGIVSGDDPPLRLTG